MSNIFPSITCVFLPQAKSILWHFTSDEIEVGLTLQCLIEATWLLFEPLIGSCHFLQSDNFLQLLKIVTLMFQALATLRAA